MMVKKIVWFNRQRTGTSGSDRVYTKNQKEVLNPQRVIDTFGVENFQLDMELNDLSGLLIVSLLVSMYKRDDEGL